MRSQLFQNTRRITVTVLFAVLLALTGCEVPNNAPKGDDPTKPKTVSELLVGKWKMVKWEAGLPANFEGVFEYSSAGNLTIWINNPLERQIPQPMIMTGTYRVEGDTLLINMGGPEDRVSTITSITEDKYVNAGWSGSASKITEFERIK